MNTEIEKLHKTLVEILEYVVTICNENQLTYFLVFGTGLGAYRHKGFIPWDDDLDIAMPRNDYQKFLGIMKQNKNHMFEIQDEDNEENWFLPFAKVRKKNTLFVESITQNIYTHNGIFVDIFPLDYVQNANLFSYKVRRKYINYLKHMLKFNACKDLYKSKKSTIGYIMDAFICIPSVLSTRRKMLDRLNKIMIGKCLKDEAMYLAQYDDNSDVQVIPIDVYFPPIQMEFEGKLYNVPHKIEEYLTYAYGLSYMDLPPIDQRITHQPIELKF